MNGILGTVVLLLGTLGGVGLGGGGGGGVVVAVLGGLVGLGAGTAFIGRAVVVVGGGGFGPFGPGDRPVVAFVGRLERKLSFLGGGLGGVGLRLGGGGFGAVVVDASPPPPPPRSPRPHPCSPTSPHPPPPRTPPPASEPTPRAGSGTAPPIRRSPRAKSPNRGDLAREQGPRVGLGPRCGGGTPGVLPGILQRLARPPGWAWHSSR